MTHTTKFSKRLVDLDANKRNNIGVPFGIKSINSSIIGADTLVLYIDRADLLSVPDWS